MAVDRPLAGSRAEQGTEVAQLMPLLLHAHAPCANTFALIDLPTCRLACLVARLPRWTASDGCC